MSLTRKAAIAAGTLVCVLVALWLFQRQLGEALFDRAIDQAFTRDVAVGLPDGLHVGLCGAGSPLPNADRAGPCNVVIAGNQMFLVDIGEGGAETLALMGLNAGDLSGVFLTHFHSDHFDGLGPLQLFHWTRGTSKAPLPVHGPQGVDKIVQGFNAAYATDDGYRIAHHGEKVVPPTGGGSEAHAFAMTSESAVVFRNTGLTVTAFTVDHSPVEPAVGYRFDYKGRSACISGDTVRSANLERSCEGVDLLVHEALQTKLVGKMQAAFAERGDANTAKIFADIMDYHTTPEDAARSAQAAGVRMLVLSHLVPPLPNPLLYPAFLGNAGNEFDGPLVVGEDGMLFSLPAGTQEIEREDLL
ncbi:MBL fold metallo-hydrolase [Qipengyuania sphaerica]|uniref:MBL fold metallo-hydrolase n=1 Tax=Qipengyuania sphaerica TaxID=2867243 RepID=UPI001C87688D|nr:MBL fold metallo-hydrolase [Qipengyuania sphaerica]MBX7540257.1 MBL fold metallo-hydrolase [Qipengyuania sphaerica]